MKQVLLYVTCVMCPMLLFASHQPDIQFSIRKAAKQEAKALQKDGWFPEPGMPTIEEQVTKYWLFQQKDSHMIYEGVGNGKTYIEAYQRAFLNAVGSILQSVGTSITNNPAMTTTDFVGISEFKLDLVAVQTMKIDKEDWKSATRIEYKTVSEMNGSTFSHSGIIDADKTDVLVSLYRIMSDGNIQIMLNLIYPTNDNPNEE